VATYDYIRLRWGASCNIGDPLNIFYDEGFANELFFDTTNKGNGSLSGALYEIEDEGKKVKGETIIEKQTWVKRYMLQVHVPEAVADVLSLLPLHDIVSVSDRDGNNYSCNGPDVTVEVATETNRELIDDERYPVMRVDITFNAYQIHKTACCTPATVVECSDVIPTITQVTEVSAGNCLIEGTAPAGMLVRLYERDFVEPVTCEIGGKINDVCIVTDLIAYCCTNAGAIFRSIDGGNEWERIYNDVIPLNGITFDGIDKIHCVGNADGGDGLALIATVGVDTFTELVTPQNSNIVSVDGCNGRAYACTIAAHAFYFDGAAWTDVTPAWVMANARYVACATNAVAMVVGDDFYGITEDSGTSWNVYALAGSVITRVANLSYTNPAAGTWILSVNRSIWVTTDNGANITEYTLVMPDRITGIECATIGALRVAIIMDAEGNMRTTLDPTVWGDLWKQRGQPIANNIAILTGASTFVIMTALGDGNVGTTETAFDEDQVTTASAYEGGGIDYAGTNNVTYQFQVETYTLKTDPCEQSAITIFTT